MKHAQLFIPLLFVFVLLLGCKPKSEPGMNDQYRDQLQSWDFANDRGMSMRVTNFGGRVVNLVVPDKNGNPVDVVLGYDSLRSYLSDNSYLGALIGRYGNRIAKGKFTLEGKAYTLAQNNGENSLHGGPLGFHNVLWSGEPFQNENGEDALQLEYTSPTGEEGFPGTLRVKVIYTLTDNNEWIIDYEATTDTTTVVNLTQHAYFNLAGSGDILNHQLEIFADRYTPVDAGLIPTGELAAVASTAFDFTTPHAIGERINNSEDQLKVGKGYDHNFVLNKPKPDTLTLAARVTESSTGIVMEVLTTEPGIQFYSGNFMDGTMKGKGKTYAFRNGFCLETQHFPDSPNQTAFPSTVLKPGQVYKTRTVYKFGAK
jgi:aldose 1-epimerase